MTVADPNPVPPAVLDLPARQASGPSPGKPGLLSHLELPSIRTALERVVGPLVLAVVTGMVFASLVSAGLWYVALGILLVPPGLVVVYRQPMVVLVVWILFDPLLMDMGGGGPRKIYWLVHRTLPMLALGFIAFRSLLGTEDRRLPRLRFEWPEVMMAGYLVATVLSVAYTSADVGANLTIVYDRVLIPMVLYGVIRLVEPDSRTIEGWFFPLALLLVVQTAIGIAQWVSPDLLPREWLSRAGSRTTGSLHHPNVFGISQLFAGAMILHLGLAAPLRSLRRRVAVPLFVLSVTMAFMTMSRATWLAAAVVIVGVAAMHPRTILRIAPILLAGVFLVVTNVGVTSQQVSDRIQSDETALTRLPVALAQLRMFEEKPLTGWGYGNFDRFDYQFQGGVGNLVVPTRDHASHNLNLTILAEQGLTGLILYLGPALVLLARTVRVRRSLPGQGTLNRKLVATLWLVAGAYVVVSNFSNVRVTFALGLWWVMLALIASINSAPARARTGVKR